MLNILNDLADAYQVPDLLNPKSRIIFVLESPHKQEVANGVPVAGRSGEAMTRHLFGHKKPLGLYLRDAWLNPGQNVEPFFGIMNMTPVPMQSSAYQNLSPDSDTKHILNLLEALRTSQARSFKVPEKEELRRFITEGFQTRLNRLPDQPRIIIPCGKFANIYMTDIEPKPDTNIIWNVPHPAYNNWSRKPQVIKHMIDQINILLKNAD